MSGDRHSDISDSDCESEEVTKYFSAYLRSCEKEDDHRVADLVCAKLRNELLSRQSIKQ